MTRRRVITPGKPQSPDEVAAELRDARRWLQALTHGDDDLEVTGFAADAVAAAEKEADWKEAYHLGMVQQAARGSKEAKHLMEARVWSTQKAKFRAWKIAEAVKESTKEALLSARADVNAIQSELRSYEGQT